MKLGLFYFCSRIKFLENNNIKINRNLLFTGYTLDFLFILGLLHFKLEMLESILVYCGI